MKRSEHFETDRTDESVDTLLAALREAEPPPAMEARVLQAVELWTATHETANHKTRAWLRSRPSTWGAAAGLATALLITGLILLPLRHSQPAAPSRPGTNAVASRSQPAPASTPGIASRALLPSPTNKFATKPLATAPARLRPAHPHSGAASRATVADAETALALAEMRAPSHPAPTEALTQQERLLLRVAHTGDPQEMAALNANLRARQETEAKAEVEAFFTPPPPPAQENE